MIQRCWPCWVEDFRRRKAVAIGVALILVALAAPVSAQTCVGAAPGAGWVCQAGGWLPPGHPGLLQAAGAPGGGPVAGITKDGPYAAGAVVYFVPPLVINPNTDISHLRGKILRPTKTAPGVLVLLKADGPMWNLNYHTRFQVSDLYVWGYPSQTCFAVQAYHYTFTNLTANQCDVGIRFDWSVNGRIEDSLFTHNRRSVWVKGDGTPNVSITTLQFAAVRAASSAEGFVIDQGLQIVLRDGTIIEANQVGLRVVPTGVISRVILRDVWFEANSTDRVDPQAVAAIEGGTGTW